MSFVHCQKQYDCFYKKNFFWKKKSFKSTYYHRGRNGFCYPQELAWLPWFQSTGVQSDKSHYTSNRCYASEGPGCCAPFQNTAAYNIEAIKGQTRQARVYYYERLFDKHSQFNCLLPVVNNINLKCYKLYIELATGNMIP